MDAKLKAFLDLVAWSEGTSAGIHPLTKNDGYDVIVTGIDGPSIFTDYSHHPFELGGAVTVRAVPLLRSSAAGRYQLLARYWRVYKEQLGLRDYSPQSQDAVAIQQMKERASLPMIEAGDIQGAIEACSNIWASLPTLDGVGTYAGQSAHPMNVLLAKYQELLG